MTFFFPTTSVSDGKFLIQHTGFVPIWKWKGNTFALRDTEGHLLKPRQSGKVHLPAARLVARGNCICPFSPKDSLQLSRSNIDAFDGARKKKKERKTHPVLGCKGCASLVLCLAQPFHRSTDIVKRGQEGSKPAAWHPFDRLPWPRKEQWLQEPCKHKMSASPGKFQAQAWFWPYCRMGVRVLVYFSVTLWFHGPLLFSCRMKESNSSPLPSFRGGKPEPQLIFMSPVPLIRRHSTARHMASPQLAVWAKLRLKPSSFQPRVTPPELGALCWSNKERRQALMSWCWSCNCLIEFAFH